MNRLIIPKFLTAATASVYLGFFMADSCLAAPSGKPSQNSSAAVPSPSPASVSAPPAVSSNSPSDNHGESASYLHVTQNTFRSDGNAQQRMQELSAAIEDNQADPELFYERAKALIQMNKINRALDDLTEAITLAPNNSDYYLARGWCYWKTGNSVLSLMDRKQARFVNPKLPAKIDFAD